MASNVAIVFTGRDRGTQQLARQLQKEFEGLRDEASRLNGVLGSLGAGLSVAGIVAYGRALTATLSGLDDLAEITGESVENLSTLAAEARISGIEIDKVASFANRLAKGLTSADDETKDVAAALKLLGVDARDANGNLKNTPVLMREIAQALQGIESGTDRQNILTALGGRSGAELIPFLNDLARSTETVTRVTADQAAAAEAAERAWRGFFLEVNQAGQAILVQSLPALEGLARGLRDVVRANEQLARDQGVASWAETGAIAIGVLADSLIGVGRFVRAVAGSFEVVIADAKVALSGFDDAAIVQRNRTLEEANRRWGELWSYNGRAVEESIRRSIAAVRTGNQALADFAQNADARDLRLAQQRRVNFTGSGNAPRTTPQRKELTEAQRALAQYVQQLERQREQLEEISNIEQVLNFLRANPGVDTPQVRELLLNQARLNDELAQERDIRRELARIQQEELAAQRALDSQLNEFSGRAEEARKIALTARLEARLAAGEVFSPEELERAVKGIAGIRDEVKQAADAAQQFGLVFASSIGRLIDDGGRGGIKAFFESLTQDLLKLTTQMLIVQPIAKALQETLKGFGGGGSGGAGGGGWASLFAGFFADGGFIPPGRWGIAGERGPEPVFGGRTGMSVVPNGAGMRPMQVSNTFVLQGPVDRRTQEQVAAAAARSLLVASRRYN